MKKRVLFLLIASAILFIVFYPYTTIKYGPQIKDVKPEKFNDEVARIEEAFKFKQSYFFVQAQGEIVRILSDDVAGSRHQRFVVKLQNGQTVLITHNIDLAVRIPNLTIGSIVKFRGEYIYNEEGGVIHWTHHDPANNKNGGWIIYNNIKHQ